MDYPYEEDIINEYLYKANLSLIFKTWKQRICPQSKN